MGRNRTLQATFAMMFSALAFMAIGAGFALVIHPNEMNPDLVEEIEGAINGVVLSFTIFCLMYSTWIVATFSLRRPLILSLEITTVLLLLIATVPFFALAYLFAGLSAPAYDTVTSLDALIFSMLTFTGVNHPSLTPSNDAMVLYTVETLLGYFVMPLLIALALIIVDRRR